jgi:hypothetical protein
MALRKTKEPGVFYDDVLNKFIKIVEWSSGDRYDTVVTASGAITAGTSKNFFRTLTDKEKLDGNFPSPRRLLSNGEEMIMERVGVYIPSAVGNTVSLGRDIKKAAENFYLTVKLDRKEIVDGPAIRFPTGYGLAGNTAENDAAVVSVGVPSVLAAPKLSRPHELNMDSDIDATGTWFDHVWDATNMPTLSNKVWHRLHFIGLFRTAATRAG